MSRQFYIPIHSMNLAHYLGSGIISPSTYIENKNPDIQNRFKNHLLLSSSKFANDTNCSIEIILNFDKEIPEKITENFYLFDKPLPISRIKSIYFTNDEQKINTNFNISSGTAFIPERLLKVSKEKSIDTKELDNVDYKSFDTNWSESLKRYDQILGGFSIIKISKERFQNYPTHYFATLGNINNLFSKTLEQQNIGIENSFQFAFDNEGKFKDFHNTIYSEVDYNEVQLYAEKDKVKLEIKNGLLQIDKIPENTQTYRVAILERYGKGRRMQVDSFISDLISGKFFQNENTNETNKKNEGLSLIFGLNKGYKIFRNKYKTQNFEVDIKFHLDSRLDYYVIESIFQNVFNSFGNILSFEYIDNLFSDNKQEVIETSNFITYQMVDKTVVWKQKVHTPIEKILARIAEKIRGWFPAFVEIKKNEIESLFKEDIEFLKNSIETDIKREYNIELEQSRIKIDELKHTILEKEKTIARLQKELTEKVQFKKEETVHIHDFKYVNKSSNLVQEDTGSLFTYDNNNIKREQLEKLPLNTLKKIAKELKIPKYSTFKENTYLIDEILKFLPRNEFYK